MTQPDIEKAKPRKRRRSARVYINLNDLPAAELERRLAVVSQHFPSDPDDDQAPVSVAARRMAKPEAVKRDIGQAEREHLAGEGRAVVNPDGSVAYPVQTHQDAENALAHIRLGHGDVKEAKRMLRRVASEEGWSDILSALGGKTDKAMGNAVPHPDGAAWTDRLSPSRVSGQAAASVGDHNPQTWQDPMNPPGPKALAMGHPDMRQGTVKPVALFSARTEADMFPRDLRGMSTGVPVALSRLDAYSAAGAPGFRQQPSGNPAMRPMDHIAPGGPSNGGHGLADAQSHAVALKWSDRLDAVKRTQRPMFPGSGGAR